MHQSDTHVRQGLAQISGGFLGGFALQNFGFLYQGADPISLALLCDPMLDTADYFFPAFRGNHTGGDGFSSRR